MSKKLADYFQDKNAKHVIKNNVIYRKSSLKAILPLHLCLAVFSLQTKPLFNFVTYGGVTRKKITAGHKQAIKQIFKGAKLVLTDIRSIRVRDMLR